MESEEIDDIICSKTIDRFLHNEPLVLKLRLSKDGFLCNYLIATLKIEIYYPHSYPITKIREKFRDLRCSRIGYLNISVNLTNITLEEFYIHPNHPDVKFLLTEEERLAFKGLGKIMLQQGVIHLIENRVVNENMEVKLEAAAGKAEKYMEITEDEISIFKNIYYEDFLDLMSELEVNNFENIPFEECQVLVSQINQNLKLTKYYENIYNMKRVGNNKFVSIQMKGIVKDLFKN